MQQTRSTYATEHFFKNSEHNVSGSYLSVSRFTIFIFI